MERAHPSGRARSMFFTINSYIFNYYQDLCDVTDENIYFKDYSASVMN